MYDEYMFCKVTLGVLKGASKLNVLLLLLLQVNHIMPTSAAMATVTLCPQRVQENEKESVRHIQTAVINVCRLGLIVFCLFMVGDWTEDSLQGSSQLTHTHPRTTG
ncbi:unnamed protein product [Boreogadus saida]